MAKFLAVINEDVADAVIIASPNTSVRANFNDVATIGATTAKGSVVVTGSGSISVEGKRLARTTDSTNTGAAIQTGSNSQTICAGD
jgi:uncharacterized Zn-binding protein involved in type VI secretion